MEIHDFVRGSLEDNKAEDIIQIDLRGKSSLGDTMFIASGRSTRHVTTIAEHLIDAVKSAGFGTPKCEGLDQGDWILIDAGDVIIHVFRPEVREFYNLEKMWLSDSDHASSSDKRSASQSVNLRL